MSIQITNLHQENGIWSYEYDYSLTEKRLIDDNFFNIANQSEYSQNDTTIKSYVFNFCDSTAHEAFALAFESLGCLQNFSVSISEQYKMAQNNYRYKNNGRGWICTDLYRDIMKMSLSIRAKSIGCEIIEIDGTQLALATLDFFREVVGSEYDSLFNEIYGGTIYCIAQPNINLPLYDNPFGTLSVNYNIKIIPKNYKKALDMNTAFDVNMECMVNGRIVIGRITSTAKTIIPQGVVYD